MSDKFEEWWREETPELGIDLILATKNKSKVGKITRDMIVTGIECAWNHQQQRIDKLESLLKEACEEIIDTVLDIKGYAIANQVPVLIGKLDELYDFLNKPEIIKVRGEEV